MRIQTRPNWFRRPITLRGRHLITQVEELIDPITGDWDREMVQDTFWEDDAKLLLALPVHEDRPNKLTWHIFSVRSAYKLCREDLLRTQANANGQKVLVAQMKNCGRKFGDCNAQIESSIFFLEICSEWSSLEKEFSTQEDED